MKLSNVRALTFGVTAAAVALVWALPALAHTTTVKATVVTVTAGKPSEFKFVVSPKTVKHGAVTFKVTNKGAVPHDFKICAKAGATTALTCTGKVTPQLAGGASATLSVTIAKAGTYEFLCSVPGHAAAGMKGVLKVT
jgi:uncharacterized cupredoxin-like copper-binding protein